MFIGFLRPFCSSQVFRDTAYRASDGSELLNGINEFLNDTTVLPPGDWDRDLLLPISRTHRVKPNVKDYRRDTADPFQMSLDALGEF